LGPHADTCPGGNRTPFEIVADIRESGSPEDVTLWLEYEEAMYRVQQLTWSKGLRRSLGLVPDAGDAVIAAEPEPERPIAVIDCSLWDRYLQYQPSLRIGLLEAAERGGFIKALSYLHQHIDQSLEWIRFRFSESDQAAARDLEAPCEVLP
jgi:hypothetical protein